MGIIYKYTSPSGKSYIGQTMKKRKEREGNNGSNYKGCSAFYKAIEKYGLENFSYEILEECENELLDEKESYYIKLYNTKVPNGYNIREGGNHTQAWSKTVYQFNQKGELISSYPSLTEAGRVLGCNIGSISEVCSGRKATLFGFYFSYEPISKKIEPRRNKTVYCFNENGELLYEFCNVKEAAHSLDVEIHQIYACASKNRRKRIKDFILTYEPFVDWNYYLLKHQRGSTTIPNGK